MLNDNLQEHLQLKLCGLNEGVVRDRKKAGVFEPAISKIKSLKFTTEAAPENVYLDHVSEINKSAADVSGRSYIWFNKIIICCLGLVKHSGLNLWYKIALHNAEVSK